MTSAAAVLVCTLSVLARSETSFPPIAFVDVGPSSVTPGAEAFVGRNPDTIYVLTSSSVYQEAARNVRRCGALTPFKKLASILVHEEWHLRHGPDERGAYQAQLTTLAFLGVHEETPVYHSVKRAMIKAVERQRRARQARTLIASREPR